MPNELGWWFYRQVKQKQNQILKHHPLADDAAALQRTILMGNEFN